MVKVVKVLIVLKIKVNIKIIKKVIIIEELN